MRGGGDFKTEGPKNQADTLPARLVVQRVIRALLLTPLLISTSILALAPAQDNQQAWSCGDK